MSTAVEPIDERGGSAVRFETQCVVIPDPAHRSRRPRVVTKSYALPLWKRRSSPSSASAPPEDASFEDKLILRLPLPTYVSLAACQTSFVCPTSLAAFHSSLTRRVVLLISRPFRLVSYIVLNIQIPPVLALLRYIDMLVPHVNPPLLRLAQTSSRYPCARVAQHVSPSWRLLSSMATRGQSIFRALPRGSVA